MRLPVILSEANEASAAKGNLPVILSAVEGSRREAADGEQRDEERWYRMKAVKKVHMRHAEHAKHASRRRMPACVKLGRIALGLCIALASVTGGFALTPVLIAMADSPTPSVLWYTDDPEATEYTLYSGSDFLGLIELVNGTATDENGNAIPAVSFEGKTIKQDGSYVLSGQNEANEITPIGSEEHPFAGTYDGQGYTIRGFTVIASSRTQDIGLFGYCSSTSTLKNISITTSSWYASKVEITEGSRHLKNIGSLVGRTEGTVQGCSSLAPVTITSTAEGTADSPSVVRSVGGLIGTALGDVTDCSYKGALTMKVSAAAAGDDLRSCQDIGGVCGRFGEPNQHGTMTGCLNTATVWVLASGAGSYDRFGVVTYARPFNVGGVVGYANGSVVNCQNGEYDSLYGAGTGTVQTSATDSAKGAAIDGQGGDQVGGVVGCLRGESDDPNRYNDGNPDDKTYVRNCKNYGSITGAVAVGGVVGMGGAYTYITQCFNGMDVDEMVGHVTSTRWNKPCTGGVLGQGRGASVSYCANYAMVENIQTGYYTAGVVGVLWIGDDYPDLVPELYACFNSGHVYTESREEGVEYREAGIVGSNEGYVHDCVMLYGTVPFHDNSPVGDNDWGKTANLHVLTQDEMQTSYCAALLNAAGDGTWDVYWYMNRSGYPVLNIWEDPYEVIELTADTIASVEVTEQAAYIGEGIEPVPTLSVTLTSGRVLWQNTDFYVVPQEGAWDITRTGEEPYSASIVGLGCFTGRVDNVCKYGIGKGDLSQASVVSSGGTYSLGRPVWPSEVTLVASGNTIDTSSYSYRIYDYNTTSLDDGKTHYVVYDSDGYASFDGGVTLIPMSEAADRVRVMGEGAEDYILYNRTYGKISDSAGNVYNPDTSELVSSTTSCIYYRTGTQAGYIIEALASVSAVKFTGSATGYYVVEAASLKDDVTIEHIYVGDKEWYWDSDSATMYDVDEDGNPVAGYPSVTFTGEEIQPTFVISYLGHTLVQGEDYRLVYGDPNDDGSHTPNLNVTTDELKGGVTVRSADSRRYSNYLPAFFEITPAKLEDCSITLDNDEYAFTGTYIEPDVNVVLNGVELVEGRDFEVTYKSNLRRGTATYTVTALDNLKGGEITEYSGTFKITSGVDIGQYKIDSIRQTYYNFGYRPYADIVVRDSSGNDLELEEGSDYTVSFSSYNVGTSTITLTGTGRYTGTLTTTTFINLCPADEDPYNQIEVTWQDMVYGTWLPEYSRTDARYNIGATCPVESVKFYPILDWSTMERGEAYTAKSAQATIGSVGATYTDESGGQVSYITAKPGTLKATVTFSRYKSSDGLISGCSGVLSKDVLYIEPVDIAQDVSWGVSEASTYTGQALTPVIGTNPGSGQTLVEGQDYTISYSDNVNVGLARYTVTAIEGSFYTGSYSGSFAILPLDLATDSTVKRIDDQPYTGSSVEPKPLVYAGTKLLTEGIDYTLSYLNNVEMGKGTVYITGMGNYGGRTSSTFTITDTLSPVDPEPVDPDPVDPDPDNPDPDNPDPDNPDNPGTTGAVSRLWGDNALGTMHAILSSGFADDSCANSYVVIATMGGYHDALTAAGLAGLGDAPVLITDGQSLSAETASEITRLGATRAYVAGGPSAVSDAVVLQIEALGVSVTRAAGDTAIDTAIAIYDKGNAEGGWGDTAIVAASTGYYDALAASPYSYAKNAPIFLANSSMELDASTLSAIRDGGFTRVLVCGGTAAVSSNVEQQLADLGTGIEVVRRAGETAIETSIAIAEWCVDSEGMSADGVAVATSESFYDALSGAAFCGQNNAPLLLVSDANRACISDFITPRKDAISDVYILGGPAAVSDDTRAAIDAALK